jgi:CDGSH-type Zn-finger protein
MQVDGVTITAYQDGPYLVRGRFQMLDQEGRTIALERPTIALCRCGKSRIRPLCDGTHRAIGFRAASAAERPEDLGPPVAVQAPAIARAADARSANGLNGHGPRTRGAGGAPAVQRNTSWASPDPDSASLRARVREAGECLARSLKGPCTACDYAAMSLAEPLLAAAQQLLESEAPGADLAPGGGSNGRPGPVGIDACRVSVERAAATARRESSEDDPRLAQVCSLLVDAAKALAS